jgi:hypothetical protein
MLLNKTGTTLIAYPSAAGAVTLDATRTRIGVEAFLFCTGLTSVSAPSATTIGSDAFAGCTTLVTATLPAVTTLGAYAFNNCTSLTTVDLSSAISIGSNAFSNTGGTALTVTLGSTPPTLGTDMFIYVYSAKNVTVMAPSASTGYGTAPTDTSSNNWGNAFRGKGWNGTSCLTGTVNDNITLIFDTY